MRIHTSDIEKPGTDCFLTDTDKRNCIVNLAGVGRYAAIDQIWCLVTVISLFLSHLFCFMTVLFKKTADLGYITRIFFDMLLTQCSRGLVSL